MLFSRMFQFQLFPNKLSTFVFRFSFLFLFIFLSSSSLSSLQTCWEIFSNTEYLNPITYCRDGDHPPPPPHYRDEGRSVDPTVIGLI